MLKKRRWAGPSSCRGLEDKGSEGSRALGDEYEASCVDLGISGRAGIYQTRHRLGLCLNSHGLISVQFGSLKTKTNEFLSLPGLSEPFDSS